VVGNAQEGDFTSKFPHFFVGTLQPLEGDKSLPSISLWIRCTSTDRICFLLPCT